MFEEYFDEDEDFVLDLDDALQAELEDTAWEAAVIELNEDTPLEDRARVYQHLRDAGALPEDASFFLIAWTVETIAEARVQQMFESQYAGRFDHLAEEYGLDEDMLTVLAPEELPEEYHALQLEFAQAVETLVAATFQIFGEHKMATLYRTDEAKFDRRYDEGYNYFFGEMNGYASDLDTGDLQD